MPANLSAAQLLSFIQCPRRFWLEQYHPEHEGAVASMDRYLDAEEAADAAARATFEQGSATRIHGRLGLRKALEQTTAALAPGAVILDATFEFEGVSTQVDVLDWSQSPYRAISVTGDTQLTARHIDDCALQAWTMRGLGLPGHEFRVALPTGQPEAAETFSELFRTVDVTEEIGVAVDRLDAVIANAREHHAALEEPSAAIGPHCRAVYDCPFLDYCEQQ